MQGNPNTLTTLHFSCTERLLTSWLLIFRHEERETKFLLCWLFLHRPSVNSQLDCPAQCQISTNWPNKRAAHPVAPSWTGLDQSQISTHFWTARPRVKISTNWPNKRAAHPVVLGWTGLAQSQISTNVFFEITKYSLPVWRHSHPSLIYYLGFLL